MSVRINPRSRLLTAFLLAAIVVVAAAGCAPRSRDLQPGLYRAVIEMPGGEVPFGLDVVREKDGVALYLVNGKERLRVPGVKAVRGEINAQLPGTGNLLEARISGDRLKGEITLARMSSGASGMSTVSGGKKVLAFSATRGRGWRFVEEPRTDNADFSGRWSFTFTDDAGRKVPGVAEFKQSFHTVAGTMRTAAWEQQPLAGDANDEELKLSLFDGQRAVLYKGKLNEQGQLVGECWSTAADHAHYTATRNPDATL
jgi:hypothetical protein